MLKVIEVQDIEIFFEVSERFVITRINTLHKNNMLNTFYQSDVSVNTAHRLGHPSSYYHVLMLV